MEKLIELLNEYNCKVLKYTDEWKEKDGRLIMKIDYNHSRSFNTDLYVISKKYGFIKWLVENEKIDNKKIADETYVKANGEWYELILGCHYDLYQQVLMLLSIQNNPIEFLISILK